jgi:hypothetical protein
MNIFVLDEDHSLNARYHNDWHIRKMPIEAAQILCSVFPPGTAPYSRTHYNHPCMKWARASMDNYQWLIRYGTALCHEYSLRYTSKHGYYREHACLSKIQWCTDHINESIVPRGTMTPFPLCMPDKYKSDDAILSHRLNYIYEKRHLAKWRSPAEVPFWYTLDISFNEKFLTEASATFTIRE